MQKETPRVLLGGLNESRANGSRAEIIALAVPCAQLLPSLELSELQRRKEEMQINERIEQSQIRVRSGVRLVAFLLLVVVCAFFVGVLWLVKLGGAAAGFFTLVTLLEYWNVRRLKQQQ